MNNKVKILFFGLFKDIMGQKEFHLEIDCEIDFKTLLMLLSSKHENFNKIKHFMDDKDKKQPVFIVLNGDPLHNPYESKIKAYDEVAFLPPVGGG